VAGECQFQPRPETRSVDECDGGERDSVELGESLLSVSGILRPVRVRIEGPEGIDIRPATETQRVRRPYDHDIDPGRTNDGRNSAGEFLQPGRRQGVDRVAREVEPECGDAVVGLDADACEFGEHGRPGPGSKRAAWWPPGAGASSGTGRTAAGP